MVIRVLWAVLMAGAAFASMGAGADIEKGNMLLKFVEVVDAMAYAAAGLCLFAVVWAGFLLMAEGPRSGARAGPGARWPWRSRAWSSRSRPKG